MSLLSVVITYSLQTSLTHSIIIESDVKMALNFFKLSMIDCVFNLACVFIERVCHSVSVNCLIVYLSISSDIEVHKKSLLPTIYDILYLEGDGCTLKEKIGLFIEGL